MPVIINGSTGVDTPAVTADSSGNLNLQSGGVTRAVVSSSGLKINRVDSSNEGGQLDLCRSSDNTSAWAIDVFGNTSTPSLRFVDNVAAASRASIDGSGNFAFNSGYGSVATAYGCRAWVNFNGTGTVAIRASGNVTSITDEGTGLYKVNFTNSISDANYAVPVGGSRDQFSVTADHQIGLYNWLTTSINLACRSEGGAYIDFQFVTCAIFR